MSQAPVRAAVLLAAALSPACGGSGGSGGFPGGDSTPSGALVAAFGAGGVIVEDLTPGFDGAWTLATDGKHLYVAGTDQGSFAADIQWRIEKRRLDDGSLVETFGSLGVVVSNPSLDREDIGGIVLDDTALYVVGADRTLGAANAQWRIEKRDLETGALVRDFGTDGVVTSDPSADDDVATAVAIDATALYVVGWDADPGAGDLQWRIEKRFLDDGQPVASFGNSAFPGVSLSNPGADDRPSAIALDAEAIYVGGRATVAGDVQAHLVKLNISSGGFVTYFAAAGSLVLPSTPNFEAVLAVALDETGLYLGVHDYAVPDGQWRIEKRDPVDGTPIASFGPGGFVTSNPGAGDEAPQWIVPDGEGSIYVSGGAKIVVPNDRAWHLEKRDASTGALDGGFAVGGQVTVNPGALGDDAGQLVTDGAFLYWAGTEVVTPLDSKWRLEKRAR